MSERKHRKKDSCGRHDFAREAIVKANRAAGRRERKQFQRLVEAFQAALRTQPRVVADLVTQQVAAQTHQDAEHSPAGRFP